MLEKTTKKIPYYNKIDAPFASLAHSRQRQYLSMVKFRVLLVRDHERVLLYPVLKATTMKLGEISSNYGTNIVKVLSSISAQRVEVSMLLVRTPNP